MLKCIIEICRMQIYVQNYENKTINCNISQGLRQKKMLVIIGVYLVICIIMVLDALI
ncbi:hypothetical protein CSC2_45010 [Clostridium zeae]|uniref:Uncharacterized protein n=1 Tax=Clostridium zeae TaxID=2759022 RepID=A0ABQ1EH71_9CLOT|nr:hypothetical protein CSC2_45010 [Clostridium zeae]